MLDPEYDEFTCYEVNLMQPRAIQSGEFKLVLSPEALSCLHELESTHA